jgi:23S rRNA (adenine2503-C2)-methyltransferase
MQDLVGLTYREIETVIADMGFKKVHASIITNYLYKRRITDLSMIPGIPNALQDILTSNREQGILPVSRKSSSDGTIKYLFRTGEGKEFETVYIPEKKRNTVCVSTQSGCRMGCKFCATGKYGYYGNLTTGEIISQVLKIPEAVVIDHVVFMGMGEPLDNLENVIKACNIMTSGMGMAMGSGNITVSSVGLLPGTETFMKNTECNFTLSLYSPFPEERAEVLPVEKSHPANEIIELMKKMPIKRGRRLTLAYVMINGKNDTDRHLQALIGLVRGSAIRINLLPFHAIPGYLLEASPAERMQYFKHTLMISGISASVRKSRGADIYAACGLLATALKR